MPARALVLLLAATITLEPARAASSEANSTGRMSDLISGIGMWPTPPADTTSKLGQRSSGQPEDEQDASDEESTISKDERNNSDGYSDDERRGSSAYRRSATTGTAPPSAGMRPARGTAAAPRTVTPSVGRTRGLRRTPIDRRDTS